MYSEDYGEVESQIWGTHSDIWYENDLQLAAELGKTLLERNKELEYQLKSSQQSQADQTREIHLLTRQLEVLRDVNDSRMKIYEEVDGNLQDLEKTNKKFRKEIKADKQRIKILIATVECLEGKCAELNSKLEELKASEKKRKRHEQKRSWNSVPSLVESSDKEYKGNFDYLGFPSIFQQQSPERKSSRDHVDSDRVRQLKETLRDVRISLATEQKKREQYDTQMLLLLGENKELKSRVKRLEKDQEEMTVSEHESYAAEFYARSTQIVCRSCHRGAASDTSSIADLDLIEHDLDELPRAGEFVKLKCGGSAYGSRESLNMMGLEADDITYEVGSDILVTGQATISPEDETKEGLSKPESSMSLLGELEVQYRKLVRKYERLIDHKHQRAAAIEVATQDNLDQPEERQTSIHGVKMRPKSLTAPTEKRRSWRDSLKELNMKSPMDPIEGYFENGPPEYKRLFKEIFETLRRSVAFEEANESQFDKYYFSSPDDAPTGLGEKSG